MKTKHPPIIRVAGNATPVQHLTSVLLTALGWGIWFYLWWPGLVALARMLQLELYLPAGAQPPDDADDYLELLLVYATVVALSGGALVLWARSNYWRFTGLERRRRAPDVPAATLAAAAGLDEAMLRQAWGAQVMTVHHHGDGRVAYVDCGVGADAADAVANEAGCQAAGLPQR